MKTIKLIACRNIKIFQFLLFFHGLAYDLITDRRLHTKRASVQMTIDDMRNGLVPYFPDDGAEGGGGVAKL